MDFKLKKGEKIEKNLQEGWHAILHGQKVKWLRTTYKKDLWTRPVLTNQRILFLKDNAIASEISLNDILKAETKRVMMVSDPYLRLHLKNGKLNHITFDSIKKRAWDSVLGVPTGMGVALDIIKEWTSEINLLIGNAATK